MKKNLLLALLSFVLFEAKSQWTYDPTNPQVVCTAANPQDKVQQVSDGNGGSFVFWLDRRLDYYHADVYGQHYDALGIELWEPGGREILNYMSSVLSFEVARPSDSEGIVIGAHSKDIPVATDSLRFQKLNDEGAKLWANDLLLATPDGCTGNYFLGFENFSFLFDEISYVVNFVPTYCGGADGCRITRFSSDGVLTGPYNGEPEGNQYYIGSRGIDRTYDGTNDVYLYYTGGNGTGAHAFVMRASAVGDSVWAPIDVLEGTNGINYKYAVMSDPDGVTIAYESTGALGNIDIFMRRLNTNGTWAWDGDIKEVCSAEGNQGTFYWVQDEEFVYICWADGRPEVVCGYTDIYAQKISKATGEMMWVENGIAVFEQCTYIPYPECVLTENGELIVCNESTDANFRFNAQLVNADGTLGWESNALLSFDTPFYSDYHIITSQSNVIVAWSRAYSGGGTDDIFIARIAEPDNTVYTNETVTACDSYEVNGITYDESGVYEIELPGDTLLTLNLIINSVVAEATLIGTTLTATNTEGFIYWLDCSDNSIVASDMQSFTAEVTGEYALMVYYNECQDTSDCYLIEIIGVDELNGDFSFTVFPNPFEESFELTFSANESDWMKSSSIEIFDVLGNRVFTRQLLSPREVLSPQLSSGTYCVQFISGSESISQIIIKQ